MLTNRAPDLLKINLIEHLPLILRAVTIEERESPKGVGLLMQIRNGLEYDQICRLWHARDRLINHLLLMGFFVHRIQIIDCDPKAISSFVSSIPIFFSLFSPIHVITKKIYNHEMNSLFKS